MDTKISFSETRLRTTYPAGGRICMQKLTESG